MKLSATLKNNRGCQKVTADDTRLSIDLRLGNKLVGTIWLYIIRDWLEGNPIGYRILLDKEIIREEEKGKKQTDKIKECDLCYEGNCPHKCHSKHID